MLSVALSGLVLICNFLRDIFLPSLCLLARLLLQKHLKFRTSHIYFHLDHSELWKQYQSVSQEMMEQICNLEKVKP